MLQKSILCSSSYICKNILVNIYDIISNQGDSLLVLYFWIFIAVIITEKVQYKRVCLWLGGSNKKQLKLNKNWAKQRRR